MKKKKYILYNIGLDSINGHIDAVHAQGPRADQYTGDIVIGVIERLNVSGIIATISRNEMDLNRPRNNANAPAIDEYRTTIKEIIQAKKNFNKEGKLTKNYLHIAIHGMRDDRGAEFEIGTRNGESCSIEVLDWFLKRLNKLNQTYNVNNLFEGDPSKSFHRNGDLESGYMGYGNKFHTIQVEINRQWRKNNQKELINFFSDTLAEFDKEFN